MDNFFHISHILSVKCKINDTHTEIGHSKLKYWSKKILPLTLTVGCSLEYTCALHVAVCFYIGFLAMGEKVRVT